MKINRFVTLYSPREPEGTDAGAEGGGVAGLGGAAAGGGVEGAGLDGGGGAAAWASAFGGGAAALGGGGAAAWAGAPAILSLKKIINELPLHQLQ